VIYTELLQNLKSWFTEYVNKYKPKSPPKD
jgi:hypothetical protein